MSNGQGQDRQNTTIASTLIHHSKQQRATHWSLSRIFHTFHQLTSSKTLYKLIMQLRRFKNKQRSPTKPTGSRSPDNNQSPWMLICHQAISSNPLLAERNPPHVLPMLTADNNLQIRHAVSTIPIQSTSAQGLYDQRIVQGKLATILPVWISLKHHFCVFKSGKAFIFVVVIAWFRKHGKYDPLV